MKRIAQFFLAWLFFGCTFEPPFQPNTEAGSAECKRQCKEAGAKGAAYDTGPFYERCTCWVDGGAP